ncbi:hypothetical protein CLOM_g1849 [Closterium sp. NIES-68]|nr:hypothetical protein CLOM_g23541 [Closterium sp. NIES-68]GJP42262.1 hypothetical protein CLOM_g1849 [Closterium sp. NIES-68]
MTGGGKDKDVVDDDVITTEVATELAYILPPSPVDQPTPDATSPSPPSPPYLLLLAPGAFIPALSYLPLIRAIRSATPPSLRKRLWVAVLKEITVPDPVKGKTWARDGYEAAVKAVKEMGADVTSGGGTPRVFALGHSVGAFLMTPVVRESCLALIQLGAWHNFEETSLQQFPRPTLTIIGSRDGQAPPISMALAVKELYPGTSGALSGDSSGGSSVVAPGSATAAALGPLLSIVQKPFVIIKGMNHAQGGNGVVNRERGDLEASRPVEEVREEIGRLVSAFILLHLHSDNGWAPLLLAGGSSEEGGEGGSGGVGGEEGVRGGVGGEDGGELSEAGACKEGLKLLRGAVGWSLDYLQPFWKAMDMEREEPQHVLDAILSQAGVSTAALPAPIVSHTIFYDFLPDFIRSKPALVGPHNNSSPTTVLQSAWLQTQGKLWPCQSHTLWVKCKTSAALEEALGLGTAPTQAAATTPAAADKSSLAAAFSAWAAAAPMGVRHVAASINEAAMQRALDMVHPYARERYERDGKKVVFGEDRILPIDGWLKADVEWLSEEGVEEGDQEGGVKGGRGVVVARSPILITPDEILPAEMKARFGGMHYMKVVTVARAMQWIMLDAFR